MVWFPFNKVICPSLLRTATPNDRSQDQSQQRCRIGLSAKANAMCASGSSGFGRFHSWEVAIWNSLFFNNMHIGITCLQSVGTSVIEVLQRSETTFKFSLLLAY
jgi:hypothetical protein